MEREINCCLIRHGKTADNLERKYAGCASDKPLCEEGFEELQTFIESGIYPSNFGRIYSSPMIRCRQTALLITGCEEININRGLTEIDFGRFEGKNYLELQNDPDYCRWIDSNGSLPFPEGEGRDEFIKRTVKAFCDCAADTVISGADTMSVFCHGGSIMAIMSFLTDEDYWSFNANCGGGYMLRLEISGDEIHVLSYNSISPGGNS